MEYDLSTDTTHVMVFKFFLRPYGFWRKVGYLIGMVRPGDILAEVESGMKNGNPGNIYHIDVQKYVGLRRVEYKGFGRVVPGNGVLRIIVDDSVEDGKWYWSMEFVSLFN